MRHFRPRSTQQGFTLFEQAVVVAGIGVASATALPQFAALQAQAEHALLISLASAAGSAMRLNQAGCAVTDHHAVPGKCQVIRHCTQVLDLLQTALPPGYRVESIAPIEEGRATNGEALGCTVARDGDDARAAFAGLVAGL